MIIPKDKLGHFIAGFAASLVGAAFWIMSGSPISALPWFACLASGMVGATKEGSDYLDNKTHPGMHSIEWLDFVATLAGAMPIVVLLWILHN